ncbi:MAG: hypothetical protein LUC83_10085 [Clostridiales bacterium]|nr:hypothetical protein [Clostridiales bacterium]
MKFKDLKTGNILETNNKEAIRLMSKKTDIYQAVEETSTKTAATTKK